MEYLPNVIDVIERKFIYANDYIIMNTKVSSLYLGFLLITF